MKLPIVVLSLTWMINPVRAVLVSEHLFGGSGQEAVRDVLVLPDGGLLLAGSVAGVGTNANRTAAGYGGRDFWLMRLNTQAQPVWDTACGGDDTDELRRALPLRFGGFLLVGASSSQPGPGKSSGLYGETDGWFARMDAQGVPIWDFSFGTSAAGEAEALAQLPDGSCFLVGRGQEGTNGNRTLPGFGGDDGYAVRLASDEGRLTSAPQTGAEIGRSGFRFTLVGQSNLSCRIERSPNLINWGAPLDPAGRRGSVIADRLGGHQRPPAFLSGEARARSEMPPVASGS